MTERLDDLKLVLPLPPNFPNKRWNWRVKLAKKKEYWSNLNMLRLDRRRIPLPWAGEAPEVVVVRVKAFTVREMDHDNLMARLKWVLDWLTAHEYIRDDRPSNLKWDGMPEQYIDHREPRFEIYLHAREERDEG